MAAHLLGILLTLAGLTGIHSLTTVSKVSVKPGGSISVPCLYDARYKNHVKYLCKGSYWLSCSSEVKTNKPSSSGKYSISTDANQGIFTVTMNKLVVEDSGYYWCAVEIDDGGDIGQYFHMSVSRDMSRLYVDQQELTVFKGGSVTVRCNYTSSPGEMKWCRLGSSCVKERPGSIDGASVTIDASDPNVFIVTMSGLETESSGWYWCAKGDLQMPVRLTVHEQSSTAAVTTATTLPSSTASTHPTQHGHSPGADSPTAEPTNITSVSDKAPGTDDGQQSDSFDLKSLLISLSVLIFIVMGALFIWVMLKRRNQAKAVSSTTTRDEQEITYSDVLHIRKTSGRRSQAESDLEAMYSSVAPKQHRAVQRVEPEVQSVIYSTVAPHQR